MSSNKEARSDQHSGDIVCTKNGVAVVDCVECGFKHIDPIPSQQELDAFYSDVFYETLWPDSIDHSNEDQEWNEMGYREKLEKCEELLPNPVNRTLLDIGAGAGFFLKSAQDAGWQGLGIEPARKACDFATNKLNVKMVQDTFTRENHTSFGRFDVVVMNKVFEHMRDPEELLSLVHSILAPGGLVCITVPNDFNPLQEVAAEHFGKAPWWVEPAEHINYFDSQSLANLVERVGFQTEHLNTSFPLEIFLLMGDDYLDEPGLGKVIHNKRKQFEMILEKTGRSSLRKDLYCRLESLGLGRELTLYARKIPA